MLIDVVDYQAGNGPSVSYALQKLNVPCRLISTPQEIMGAQRLILPGVGAAEATMASLREGGYLEALTYKILEERIPFLGICIGLQILFEHSEEQQTTCLGWLPGGVRKFRTELPVPHIGWNQVEFLRSHPVLGGLPAPNYFYFVNSYYAVPHDESIVYGTADYDGPFCAVIISRNIVATQFHVEKSGPAGLKLLQTFATMERSVLC